ncbi:MAG TPA: prepilin-type N-terminal cleavage/methylation domain-containing protein [Solirubrobacteraceae bacterium]|jgi:type II secretory pathway pseudopilin PulG
MSSEQTALRSLADERGFTLIELVIAMAMGIVVSLAAFALLKFTTSDVSRITERVHVDQTGSVALERVMLELHSACVAPSVSPIQTKSNENTIRFISEGGSQSALTTVALHEIIYNKTTGTLTEKSFTSIPPPTGKAAPEYTFPTTATSTTLLLTGVQQSESEKKLIPIFQYFRYYGSADSKPVYGEINPAAMLSTSLEKESEAERVAKVTVSLTLTPKAKESATLTNDRPVPLEDSAVFRLAPSSEATTNPNLPCSPQT